MNMRKALRRLSGKTISFLGGMARRDRRGANEALAAASGVRDFFGSEEEFITFRELLSSDRTIDETGSRREFGDYQTPPELADSVCALLHRNGVRPEYLIEPTFGKGAFILSAIRHFPRLETIHGVEIHEPYLWHTRFALLEYFLDRPSLHRPAIHLQRHDLFAFDFAPLAPLLNGKKILLLGNPPWVTNAELGRLASSNLPRKSNFRKLSGLDAMTGKSNFDIAEHIVLKLLEAFSINSGHLAMLLKNMVVRNLVHDLPDRLLPLSDLASYRIDAKRHFDASVEASLFTCRLNCGSSIHQCRIADLKTPDRTIDTLGWVGGRFVSDVARHADCARYDGLSPLIWRQGIKHDCARVMELRRGDGGFINRMGESLEPEEEMIYGLLKSSDLQRQVIESVDRYVIVPQQRIGEDPIDRLKASPKLHAYLLRHRKLLDSRKSSIYRHRPPFSIFGIGDYSFRPYKVAISGLYKHPSFALVLPSEGRPVMLDDTCYFLGFDRLDEALCSWVLLNGRRVRALLDAITFTDAKRPFTKEVLMRIDLAAVADRTSFDDVEERIEKLRWKMDRVSKASWEAYVERLHRHSLDASQTPSTL
jgi:hypothetical protein